MALVTPKAVFFHVPLTGGAWVRQVLRACQVTTFVELKGKYACPCQCDVKERFSFTFVRHPLSWYESYYNFKNSVESAGWDPKVDFDRVCREDSFDGFITKIIENFPRFLSCMYKMYTEIDTPRELGFIGRQENLREDLIKALTLAQEDFDPQIIRRFPAKNIGPTHPSWDPKLRAKIVELESFTLQRFGYEA